MHQFSLARIRRDWERLAAGGIEDLWVCDSNFGALREDVAKAEIAVELKRRTGLPRTFATSWSKNHNQRVQRIVRLLHRDGLLTQYHLALQTLTPRALELSRRTNMRANDYEPVVRSLAAEGVPVAAELIWGLPGDTLPQFEANLEHLMTVFPNINIFAYTLLPGTELFERRDEYRLATVPVAGYGKAKGEYVVACHTFGRDEGEEGYALITAYILLVRGQIMRFTLQLLATAEGCRTGRIMRGLLRALLAHLGPPRRGWRISAYERRSDIYLALAGNRPRTYSLMRDELARQLEAQGVSHLTARALQCLQIDEALCPRSEPAAERADFDFEAAEVARCLGAMRAPADEAFAVRRPFALAVHHPGGLGSVVRDPDGGAWIRGRIDPPPQPRTAEEAEERRRVEVVVSKEYEE
jgi:hypothetical protein